MALPTLDATFASAADLPRRQMLAKWLVNLKYSGLIEDYWTLPEHYLWAKIAVAAGAPRSEADYISLPKNYVWSDLYNAVSGSSGQTIDRGEKEAIGWIAAAVRGDAGNPEAVATYINWPWRYQVASIITALAVDADAQSFITISGATDVQGVDKFVKGVKNLGLWDSMVCWPLRSSQNAGTGTTAYSLGGLGTYNGTLVNGPVWTADGIDFVAASSTHITTALDVAGLRKFTTMIATDPASYVSLDAMIGAWGTNNYLGIRRSGSTSIDFIVSSGGTKSVPVSGASEDWRVYGWGTQGANTVATASGAEIATLAFVPDQSGARTFAIGILAPPLNAPYNGKIGWVFFIKDAELTTAQQLTVYNLYKSTLGTGLSLP